MRMVSFIERSCGLKGKAHGFQAVKNHSPRCNILDDGVQILVFNLVTCRRLLRIQIGKLHLTDLLFRFGENHHHDGVHDAF